MNKRPRVIVPRGYRRITENQLPKKGDVFYWRSEGYSKKNLIPVFAALRAPKSTYRTSQYHESSVVILRRKPLDKN